MADIAVISLGCPKNLVDSECVLAQLADNGHTLVSDSENADVVVINTCAFIESAREESRETIEDALENKARGNVKAVVVAGCFPRLEYKNLKSAYPQLDAICGLASNLNISDIVDRVLAGNTICEVEAPPVMWEEPTGRIPATPQWTAYLKVSDGCDNRCSYCVIPDIRGGHRSRPSENIVDEAKALAQLGYREIILVGQDLTNYGTDLDSSCTLEKLVCELNAVDGISWIRLLYCYPSKITSGLVSAIADCEKVLPYMDIPFQHSEDRILQAMNRRGSREDYLRLVDNLRSKVANIALRSSFIVGFPQETDEDFEGLVDFIETIRFDRVGIFCYSPEENTPAAKMKDFVSRKKAEERFDRAMQVQQEISLDINRTYIGTKLDVIIEGETDEGLFGRSYRDAPDIDGVVYLPDVGSDFGEIVQVEITDALEYDLIAK